MITRSDSSDVTLTGWQGIHDLTSGGDPGPSGTVRSWAKQAARLVLSGGALASVAACDDGDPVGPIMPVDEVVYATEGTDYVHSAAALPDGGFVVAGLADGVIAPADGTNGYPLLLHVTPEGLVEDAAVYRDIGYGSALAAVPFENELGVLVQHDKEIAQSHLTLYRTRLNGARQEAVIRLPESPYGRSLLRTRDGGFLVVLSRVTASGDDLVKLDEDNRVSWTYRMSSAQIVVSAAEAPNGDVLVLGVGNDARSNELARLRPNGHERWRRSYGGDTFWGTTIVAPVADGAVVLGTRFGAEPEGESVVVSRFDAAGDIEWERTYATGGVYAGAITGFDDGGIVFAYAEVYGETGIGRLRSYVVRASPDGEEEWREPFGPRKGTTYVSAIIPLSDGRIVAVGDTGPDRIGGFGGDPFDILAVFYRGN